MPMAMGMAPLHCVLRTPAKVAETRESRMWREVKENLPGTHDRSALTRSPLPGECRPVPGRELCPVPRRKPATAPPGPPSQAWGWSRGLRLGWCASSQRQWPCRALRSSCVNSVWEEVRRSHPRSFPKGTDGNEQNQSRLSGSQAQRQALGPYLPRHLTDPRGTPNTTHSPKRLTRLAQGSSPAES